MKKEERPLSQIARMGRLERGEDGHIHFVSDKERRILWAIAGLALGLGGLLKVPGLMGKLGGGAFCLFAVMLLLSGKKK